MEFETNKPTTAQDIALADAPHVTVQPIHVVAPDLSSAPGIVDPATRRTFSFETETTVVKDSSKSNHAAQHRVALFFGIFIALLFAGALTAFYLNR